MAIAAIRRAFAAVFSEEVGSGITEEVTCFASSVLRSAGEPSEASEGMEPSSADESRLVGFSLGAGEACFKKACKFQS